MDCKNYVSDFICVFSLSTQYISLWFKKKKSWRNKVANRPNLGKHIYASSSSQVVVFLSI